MLSVDKEIEARTAEKVQAAKTAKAREEAVKREQAAKERAAQAAIDADHKREADLRNKLREAHKARDAADSTAAQARAAIEKAEEAVREQAAKAAQFEGLKARIADAIASQIAEAAATGADADLTLPAKLEAEKAEARRAEADLAAARETLEQIKLASGPLSARQQSAGQAAYDAGVAVQNIAREITAIVAARYTNAIARELADVRHRAAVAAGFRRMLESMGGEPPAATREYAAAFEGLAAHAKGQSAAGGPNPYQIGEMMPNTMVLPGPQPWTAPFPARGLAEGEKIWSDLFEALHKDADAKPALEA
jgi:colicin import membrane protein